ncbi:MAG: phosphoglycerate mutase (2,3-diphosphoglycerate-independent) [Flavobacteriales bacterium]|nr:phosphoglycerate mutase (2,3-diphosphoglycerate-independent) [Flavobacteriales bacterium]|tara:strand:- start:25727 stop:27244 length:1518 start_codon:yes stop_codon:yes gene_type:complete
MAGKKTVLIILDGWGHGNKTKSDAIHNARTPFVDSLYNKYPNCELLTAGEDVGLPKEQMGNSEVGHLNIGAGRIVYQDLQKINIACDDNSIADMENLKKSFIYAKEKNKPLHLIGLVSDGGIHSHQNHLYKLCELANKAGVKDVFIHAFTDGRDCDPKSGKDFIKDLERNLFGAKIASVCGRYYAMDRDKRWERIKLAFNLMVNGEGEKSKNLSESIQKSYNNGVTDEFIKPIISVDENDKPITKIKEGDAVICFNFRTDRCREITVVLTQKDMLEFEMKTLDLHYTTLTNYDEDFKNIHVIYDKENIKNTLGEVLEQNSKNQIRIAETEKYPHVTFFFSGGREKEFIGEKRLMVNSPKVRTYDLQPEMSALEVTSNIVSELEKREADFICLNFANADMVGHTGDYNAIINAVEAVDKCVKTVVESGKKNNYALLIISDHGNADFAINADGSPNTAHSINPVPCFAINTGFEKIENGKLGDIAPTILKIMELEVPEEMTGKILIR